MIECENQTFKAVAANSTAVPEVVKAINQVIMPAVCVFGMIGNVLNLTILTRRTLQKSFRKLEKAANFCLIALAVSDLMFCTFVLPHTFLPSDGVFEEQGMMFLYAKYCAAIINIFIMESTYLTVAMSLERYLACCFPLRRDLYLTSRRIKYVIVLTVIFSLGFNIPVFWRFETVFACSENYSIPFDHTRVTQDYFNASNNLNSSVPSYVLSGQQVSSEPLLGKASLLSMHQTTESSDTSTTSDIFDTNITSMTTIFKPLRYKVERVLLLNSKTADATYRILWAIFGNFIPLVLLLFFNVCLCKTIFKSFKMRRQFSNQPQAKSSSNVLTLTLVAIVIMFFILVAPSEIVIWFVSKFCTPDGPTHLTIECVFNLMQSVNFSVNFILYCIISPYFRRTLKYLLFCGCYKIYQVSRTWAKSFEISVI